MLYAESYATPLATIYRKRTLPIPGVVSCRYGDTVSAERIIAEAEMHMGYHVLDLEALLGMRVKDARRFLLKKVGDAVDEGEVALSVEKGAAAVTGEISAKEATGQ